MWALLPHLKQRFNLIYYSHSGDPNGAYPRFPMSIFIALRCLGCNSDLAKSRKAVMFCQETGFGVRRSISLYYLLIMFAQISKISGRSTPIKKVFNLKFKDLIKLLISVELF